MERGISDSVCKSLCRYDGGIFLEADMEIKQGYSYHIKHSFFLTVKDSSLMSNKEGGNYRPHYYAIEDSNDRGIFWMIPISSKVEKYKKIICYLKK